jgi:hypothetical protein
MANTTMISDSQSAVQSMARKWKCSRCLYYSNDTPITIWIISPNLILDSTVDLVLEPLEFAGR